jgi:hypothetical protein
MLDSELEPGKEYEVAWDDCCVAGSFAGELFEKIMDADGVTVVELRWSNGVTTSGFGYTYRPLQGSGEAEHEGYVAVES